MLQCKTPSTIRDKTATALTSNHMLLVSV